MEIAFLILASGAGTRFDGIKQLADVEGEPMIVRVCRHLNALGEVIVVLGAYRDQIELVLASLDVTIVENADWEKGMSSGIKAGIAMLENREVPPDSVLITLADLPHLKVSEYQQLINCAVANPERMIASSYDAVIGVPAIFPRSSWEGLKSLHGDKGARAILRNRTDVLFVNMPNAARDVDTSADLN